MLSSPWYADYKQQSPLSSSSTSWSVDYNQQVDERSLARELFFAQTQPLMLEPSPSVFLVTPPQQANFSPVESPFTGPNCRLRMTLVRVIESSKRWLTKRLNLASKASRGPDGTCELGSGEVKILFWHSLPMICLINIMQKRIKLADMLSFVPMAGSRLANNLTMPLDTSSWEQLELTSAPHHVRVISFIQPLIHDYPYELSRDMEKLRRLVCLEFDILPPDKVSQCMLQYLKEFTALEAEVYHGLHVSSAEARKQLHRFRLMSHLIWLIRKINPIVLASLLQSLLKQ